ncbi:MAG: family transcriptional regulator, cyclic receptor protein [Actinomycetota bacterium]|jgi:CRP-like cAMP-binding protein|nr:family transcriptional regulator, cyclic receptor protein [Actinomycetota bacterium]
MPADQAPLSVDSFLSDLSATEHDALFANKRKRQFHRSATLINAGTVSNSVAVILEGRIKLSFFTDEGHEVVLAIRGPGDLVGDLSALDGQPHSATATALEPVEAMIVAATDFTAFLFENPRVALMLLRMLSSRLRDADEKRIEFSAYDSVGRVARRLVEMADRFGDPRDQGLRITLPLSQEELAGWTGSSREAVSKALQTLRSKGLIETERRAVTILDLPGLATRAL